MKFHQTSLPGVLVCTPEVFQDERGYFFESFKKMEFEKHGLNTPFVQDNQAFSQKGAIRGLHYQLKFPQGKLVSVVMGKVIDFAVDIRKDSPTFGQHYSTILSEKNHKMMYVPEGFAHGYGVLSETALFQYKCTDYYHPEDEYGVYWDDPQLDLPWDIDSPVISPKDDGLPHLKQINPSHLPVFNGADL